jgi:hypothetical protein
MGDGIGDYLSTDLYRTEITLDENITYTVESVIK